MDRPILFCVASEKGYEVTRAVRERFPDLSMHITTFKESSVELSYDEKIRTYAAANDIPVHPWKQIREGGSDWIAETRIHAIVCVSWRYLLPESVVRAVGDRVIVGHESLLPRYRGFAPLPTAMINGDRRAGVTVLLAAPDVDAGDILYQESLDVGDQDTIEVMIRRIIPLYARGIIHAISGLLSGNLARTKQDHTKATFSIWRDETDLFIDWNESAERIERTVRALGPPYLGAKTHLDDKVVTIRRASVVEDLLFEIRQPGKIWQLTEAGAAVVVCGEGMLRLDEADIDTEGKLTPMTRVRKRFY